MRTFKHEPFLIVGGRGRGGLICGTLTVLMNVNGTSVLIHFNFENLPRILNIFECVLN